MTATPAERLEGSTLPTYTQLLNAARRWRAQRDAASQPTASPSATTSAPVMTRVAVIGNSTLQFLRDPLEYLLAQRGVRAELFLGDFDNHTQEILSPDSRLHAFQPQVVVLLLDHHAYKERLPDQATWSDLAAVAKSQVAQLESWWDAIRSRSGAAIVQTNIALPVERSWGHLAAKSPNHPAALWRRINEELAEVAPTDVSIVDVEHLSGIIGKQAWFDAATWYTSHQGFGFAALPSLVHSLAAVVAGILGKTRKCLVLDLDNTLWGGTIGDLGVHGIQLGIGDAQGEPFVDFQRYCLELKQRGILLAVCSKNEDANARQPFLSHPDTVLKLDDFAAFVANWDDKATNLQRIAQQLNLGLDSFVFVDDNPAERHLVRTTLPMVAVPELPEDPALYRRILDQGRYFEVSNVSQDDRQRAGYYAAEQRRREAVEANTAGFLESLDQECETGLGDDATLPRILQLLNKTNQWNLTTRRFTDGELRALTADPGVWVQWLRSRDRFGENGLVSVVIGREHTGDFAIEDWVMSCRVFKRGIEDLVFNEILQEARRRGAKTITGRYAATEKNKLVATWYATLGFQDASPADAPGTIWRLELTESIPFRTHTIRHQNSTSTSTREPHHDTRAA